MPNGNILSFKIPERFRRPGEAEYYATNILGAPPTGPGQLPPSAPASLVEAYSQGIGGPLGPTGPEVTTYEAPPPMAGMDVGEEGKNKARALIMQKVPKAMQQAYFTKHGLGTVPGAAEDRFEGMKESQIYATLAMSDKPEDIKLAKEMKRYKRVGGEEQVMMQTVKAMPELKQKAIRAQGKMSTLDGLIGLAETGKVTGKGGQLKAFLAPWAEMVGIQKEDLQLAQMFALMTRAQVGQFRLDIVGPGPVSEYEGKLMGMVSGGGGVGQKAAIQLLNYWKDKSKADVDLYNVTVEDLRELHPTAGRIYRKIGAEKTPPLPTEQPVVAGGKRVGAFTVEVE